MHGLAPNDIKMQFKDNPRLGIKAVVPPLFNKSQLSTATHYENSFAVKAAVPMAFVFTAVLAETSQSRVFAVQRLWISCRRHNLMASLDSNVIHAVV